MNTIGTTTTAADIRHAALIDIDNAFIVRGHLLCPAMAAPVLDAIEAQVAGMPARAACGRSVLNAHMAALAACGWGLTSVPPTPNAADEILAADGRTFVGCGVTDLTIVSGDAYFAALATIARLHVLAPRGCLSQQLQVAATSVTYLPTPAPTRGAVAA